MQTLQDLIDSGVITEVGLGTIGELCCENCIDENGTDSTDLSEGSGRCGDKRYDYTLVPGEDGAPKQYTDPIELKVGEVNILIACDSCDSEVRNNRQNLYDWYLKQNQGE